MDAWPVLTSLFDALARNWALVAIVLTVTVLVVIPLLVLYNYVRIALNIMRSTRPPLSRNPLDFEPVSGEPVQFNAYDGLALAGMVIRGNPAAPRRGTIVFAHESSADMTSCARYCRPLLQVGYDVFTFDFRGHGQSQAEPGYEPRQWVTDRELSDLRGALAWVDAWLSAADRPREIAIVGVSRGACAAILAAAENPRVRAIVCDGAFDTACTLEYFLRRWAAIFATIHVIDENGFPRFWRAMGAALLRLASREFRCKFPSVKRSLQRMTPRPLLMIHGEKDSYLPVDQSRLLYAVAGQPKTLWIAPGAKHNQAVIVHPERYAALTLRFLDEHLARYSGVYAPAMPDRGEPRPLATPGVTPASVTPASSMSTPPPDPARPRPS